MDSHVRTVAKAVSWQLVGIIVMTLIGYAFTGSIGESGGFAVVAAASGLVMYVIHERLWARIRWGRRG